MNNTNDKKNKTDVVNIAAGRRRVADNNAVSDPKRPTLDLCYAVSMQAQHGTVGSLLYRWTGEYWRVVEPAQAEKNAFAWLSTADRCDYASAKRAQSLVSACLLHVDPVPKPRNTTADHLLIPVKNGVIRIDDDGAELIPPDRKQGLLYQLPCVFDSAAQAPVFEKFLNQILPDPDIRSLVQEYVGYTLTGDTRYQVAQLWIGEGANGKSTLTDIVRALHAKTAALDMGKLTGFQIEPLIGATLVQVDEMPQNVDQQRFKTLVSGGLAMVERKHRDNLIIEPTAKWILCGNHLPVIRDQSTGFWRRLQIVPFGVHIPTGERDGLLAKKIIDNELAGVLNWSIAGLLRLNARGHFPPPSGAMLSALDDAVGQWWFYDGPAALGDAIAARAKISGQTWREAALALAHGDHSERHEAPTRVKPNPPLSAPPRPFKLPEEGCRDEGRQYLLSRGISPKTLNNAEAAGALRYTSGGVVFIGRDSQGVARSATIRPTKPSAWPRDVAGSQKAGNPVILPGDGKQIVVVEGGADALAAHELSRSRGGGGQHLPTVICTGGCGVGAWTRRPDLMALMAHATRVIIMRDRESTSEKQLVTDAAHERQAEQIRLAIGGDPSRVALRLPSGMFKDLAEVTEARVRDADAGAREPQPSTPELTR